MDLTTDLMAFSRPFELHLILFDVIRQDSLWSKIVQECFLELKESFSTSWTHNLLELNKLCNKNIGIWKNENCLSKRQTVPNVRSYSILEKPDTFDLF